MTRNVVKARAAPHSVSTLFAGRQLRTLLRSTRRSPHHRLCSVSTFGYGTSDAEVWALRACALWMKRALSPTFGSTFCINILHCRSPYVKISFEMLLLEASWQKKMYTELIFRRTPLGIFQCRLSRSNVQCITGNLGDNPNRKVNRSVE